MKNEYEILVKRAAKTAICVAILLFSIKTVAWWLTQSVSILASLVDSSFDIIISLTNFFIVRYALQPADEEHRFGHGKAESLAALGQSTFICGSALFLVLSGIERIMSPRALEAPAIGLGVTFVSFVISGLLVAYQRRVIKRTGSQAIRADMMHYQTDVLMNLAVFIALLCMWQGYYWADGAFALFIGFMIFYNAIKMGCEAVQALLDRALPAEEIDKIEHIACQCPGVIGVHDIRTRQSGAILFIQLHVELDDNLPLVDAHAIGDHAEAKLLAQYPTADIIIHLDPTSVVPK